MQAALQLNPFSPSLAEDEPQPMALKDAIGYALEAGGSGFRYKLGLEAGKACGLSGEISSEMAEGIEYFHHASLIFDDLPSMDDATDRRGRPCLHRVAGESQAILAALALVNRAYSTFWKTAARYPKVRDTACRLLEKCIGEHGILEGQARDLAFRSGMGTREVKAIAVGKTGTLLKLTLLLPAILGEAGFRERLLLARLSRDWGIAYQALDDFSDLLFSDKTSGKTPFRDLSMERPNLVIAMGIRPAHEELLKVLRSSLSQITRLVAINSRWSFLLKFHENFTTKEQALHEAIRAA
jgi:geranylgeranyl pyrophosphate synthase